MTPIYFLFLLTPAYAKMIIDIDVTSYPPVIDFRGRLLVNVISDQERTTFGIEDRQLKKAIAEYTKHAEPNSVFVKRTGNKNDLYEKYKDWKQVMRTVKPRYFDVDISHPRFNEEYEVLNLKEIYTNLKTDWNINETLSITDNITYNIYYDNGDHDSSYNLTFNSQWGENIRKLKHFGPFPTHKYKTIQSTLKVTVKFETSLAGDVTMDYVKKRKNGHFWAYDLINVQNAAGLKKSVISSETITITYFKLKPRRTERPSTVSSITSSSTRILDTTDKQPTEQQQETNGITPAMDTTNPQDNTVPTNNASTQDDIDKQHYLNGTTATSNPEITQDNVTSISYITTEDYSTASGDTASTDKDNNITSTSNTVTTPDIVTPTRTTESIQDYLTTSLNTTSTQYNISTTTSKP